MRLISKFTFRMKSEPKKKAFKWTVSEDKVIWLQDNRKLRQACRRMKAEGIRKHQFILVRDWFMVEVGLFTGLRVMEIQNLRIGDMLIRSNMSSIHVRCGKGQKRRDVYINAELKHECIEYLKIRKSFNLPCGQNDYVFCKNNAEPVTTRCLQKAFKRCLARAGISWNYTFHCMRHTYATFLLELSNLRVVQEQLGHSSVKTTEIYTSLIRKSLKKALDKIYR